ncbi:MAG: hypothetical protein PUC54_00525 [Clostridiales bacterium]|nr:hypothetical protein [Clostridiales bacterium]
MRRILSAVLLAAMLAFSLVPAYAAPGTGEGQCGRLQEDVDAAKDGKIIEVSKEDDAESITVAGKAVIIFAIDGEWSERTTDTECIARLEGNDGNGAYYVVGDLDRCVACDTKAICGAEAASYELKKSIKLKSDVTFANCGMDTSGITVKRELCIDLNGRTIAQEQGENAYNACAAVNVNIEGGTLTIRDSSEDKSGCIIGNTVAIVVAEGRCVLEGGSIASRGEYCDFGDGMVFAGAPVRLTEGGKGFLMTGGRISMAELEEGGMLAGDFYDAVGGRIEISGGEVFCVPEENLCTADPTDGFYSYMDSRGSVSISGGYFDFEPDAEYIDDSMKAVEAVRPGYKFTVTDGSPDPWKDQQTVQEENSFNGVRSIRVMAGGETRQVERPAAPQWKPEPLDGSLVLLVPKTGDRPLLYRLFSLLRIK